MGGKKETRAQQKNERNRFIQLKPKTYKQK